MIDRFDHIVLTVRSLEATLSFYERVLGICARDPPRRAGVVQVRPPKNQSPRERSDFRAQSGAPGAGAADFCLITHRSMDETIAHLNDCGVTSALGPLARVGAQGPMTSVYIRDPDANLVEIGR
jgi:catechol 2,3-dioxygenase-like lactoylglutathione lyase family enzyme